jgi:hypothetical protein
MQFFFFKIHFVNVETDPGLWYMFWDCPKLDFFGVMGQSKMPITRRKKLPKTNENESQY